MAEAPRFYCDNGPDMSKIIAAMPAPVAGGILPNDADTIAARIANKEAVDAKLREWQDSELGIYDLEAVRELGHNVI